MFSESDYINHCKRQIEKKFKLENTNGVLRQRDLEYIATRVEEKSGTRLSLSTLKRIWKNEFSNTPQPATLNGFAMLLGYADWQEFKSKNTPEKLPEQPAKKNRIHFNHWIWPSVAAVVVVFWLIAFRSQRPGESKPIIKGAITFSGNKTVSQGVPNTVIFNYDVTNIEADSFFFQQSWNNRDRISIDPAGHYYSNIYYYPGFHKAKLIANDSIVSRFKVHITTDGWLPLARHHYADLNPIYIKTNPVRDGVLHVPHEEVLSAGASSDKPFMTSYFNVRDFGETDSDNFSLDIRIASDRNNGVVCPGFQVIVMCEVHIFYVHVLAKGCERDISVKMGEVVQEGVNNDLSMLGRDVHEWQNLSIKVVDKKATILFNGQPVHAVEFKSDFGRVVGLVTNFAGTGSVDNVLLKNGKGEVVYEDEF